MSNRDWDKELAMIDRQLASISDEQLAADTAPPAPGRSESPAAAQPARQARPAAAPAVATPAQAPAAATPAHGWRTRIALNGKLLLAVAAAVGIVFWPYGWRCGSELAVYMAAVLGVTLAGLWAARSTWRHRAGKRHVLALLVVLWGIGLATWQILPRAGLVVPTTMDRPAIWACT